MKSILRLIAIIILGVAIAAVQVTYFSMSQSVVPIDIILALVLTLYLRSHPIWATLILVSGYLTIDVVAGWATPGHLIAGAVGWFAFIIIRQKALVAQTTVAIAASVMIASVLSVSLTVVWSAVPVLAVPDSRWGVGEAWVAGILRVLSTSVLVTLLSRRAIGLSNRYRS